MFITIGTLTLSKSHRVAGRVTGGAAAPPAVNELVGGELVGGELVGGELVGGELGAGRRGAQLRQVAPLWRNPNY